MGARGREAPDGVFPPAGSRGFLRGERGPWTDGGSEPRGARWRGAGAGELRIGASGKSRCVLRSCSPESAGHLPGPRDASGGPERGRRRARGGCGRGPAGAEHRGHPSTSRHWLSDRREVTLAFPAAVGSQCRPAPAATRRSRVALSEFGIPAF